MSGERIALPTCSRTRSYGSLVRSPLTPTHHGRVEHTLQPGETLQGLALKYGVTMEQIKRENRLYTNDSIFLKKSLSIPVMAELDACMATSVEGGRSAQGNELLQEDGRDITELTPNDFLKRLDGLISQSKHAAVKGCQDAEKRITALEAVCSRGTSFRRSQSAILASEQNEAVTVPQTITRLTRKMREREDEIFEL
ncbi:lysM and putative peptidoglycan-binding domain-containing protein 1 [Boleophthalmus pectinirostris]|uniref:lysM and putative peptidoglycan-binding domain-containing protein 1 n=1 Tax=Boleophthalmus pectinirostris TaxID=150288 RepID=UPI000A1C4219|nr:lysM and putative peptidoglycan-binding domain-containing protein 1 [Boleophthalmus pectinirostris]